MTDVRATYRLQLGPDLGFRGGARARPVPRGARRLAPLPLAVAPGPRGLDARLRRRRPDARLGGSRRRGRAALALGGRAGAGLGIVLDIVPNHMAATDENPFWRDPLWRAKFFDLDWRTGVHRRFFDVGELAGVRMEDPEVWEVTHAKVVELAQDGVVDGVRVDHPDGLANPRRYLERLRESGIERVWVEKILEPGERLRPDWPVEGTTGYEFLNDVTALFVVAGGGGAADAALRGADRRAAVVRGGGGRGEARAGARRRSPRRRRSWRRSCRSTRTSSGRSRRSTSTAPTSSRTPALVTDADRAAVAAAALPRRAGADPAARGARARRVRRPLPADDAAGAREGRRGHGVLPLEPLRRAERGRRRPGPLLALGRRLPRGEPGAAARAACSRRRRTTRSGAATSARGWRRSRTIRPSGRRSSGRGSAAGATRTRRT